MWKYTFLVSANGICVTYSFRKLDIQINQLHSRNVRMVKFGYVFKDLEYRPKDYNINQYEWWIAGDYWQSVRMGEIDDIDMQLFVS